MRYIVRRNPRSVWKGLVAGLAGGFAASWTMNQFQKMLAKAAKAQTNGQGSSEEEDITGKTADTIYHAVSGKRLSREGRRTGGSVVHYVFGTAMGGAYGAAAEVMPRVKSFAGLPYGALLFAGADEAALPLLKLSRKPHEYPFSTHLYALSSHAVYGLTAEMTRRLVRRLIR